MFDHKKRFFMVLLLAAALTLTGGLTAAAGTLLDLQEAQWAEQAITEMYASGIVAGYPGGVYKPYNSVTRLEAVAMLVRALGLEEQARAKENAKVDYKMPAGLFWGRGYLIMGVELGMLNKDYLDQLQPASPASRVEVAMLVYHALNLSPDSSPLTFADADQVPAGYREGVAAVVKNNLMKGLPGNVFKPNDGINRAQMAVLLSNIVEYKPSEAYRARRLSGTLSAIDLDSRVLSIQNGTSKFFTPGCTVFIDGKKAQPSGLGAGDEVKLILDDSGQVVYIKAQRVNAGQKYKGKVDSLFGISGEYWLALAAFDGNKITRPVMSGLTVNESGNPKDISSLSQGSYVEIKVVDNKITEINVLKTSTVKGRVESVRSSGLSLRDDGGSLVELSVPGNVVVKMNNATAAYSDVQEGDRVEVTVCESKAVKIEILSQGDMEGKIRKLDTSGTWGITIEDEDGDEESYVVNKDVEVEKGGEKIGFDELAEGDRVRLILDSKDRVTRIKVLEENASTITGVVTELETGGSPMIRIKKSNGRQVQYDIADNVTVRRDSGSIDLDDIVIGCEVKILLDDDEVDRIEITNDEDITVKGEVTYVNAGRKKLQIEQVNGNKFTYYLADDADLEDEDGDSIDLDDVRTGWDVELELENGEVIKLTRQ